MASSVTLLPDNTARSSFSGFIDTQGCEFCVRVRTSAGGAPCAVQCDAALQQLLAPHLRTLETRMLQSASVTDFVAELHEILDHVLRAVGAYRRRPSSGGRAR